MQHAAQPADLDTQTCAVGFVDEPGAECVGNQCVSWHIRRPRFSQCTQKCKQHRTSGQLGGGMCIVHQMAAGIDDQFFRRLQCLDFFQQYRSFYHARKHAETSVYPGVSEGLRALRGKKSTATSKGTPFSRFTLEHFGLLQYFDHVQGTDGFPSKPAPNVIFTALAALGAKPEDCLFVGDSRVDMEAGRRAGVKTCAVRYGYGKEAELAQFEPDYWVDDLRELAS